MVHKIFCIYDGCAKAYLPPFFLPETAMALRTFSDCCNSDDHQFGMHPGDYTLFCMGTFDDNSSRFETHSGEKVANGVEVIVAQAGIQSELFDGNGKEIST